MGGAVIWGETARGSRPHNAALPAGSPDAGHHQPPLPIRRRRVFIYQHPQRHEPPAEGCPLPVPRAASQVTGSSARRRGSPPRGVSGGNTPETAVRTVTNASQSLGATFRGCENPASSDRRGCVEESGGYGGGVVTRLMASPALDVSATVRVAERSGGGNGRPGCRSIGAPCSCWLCSGGRWDVWVAVGVRGGLWCSS